MRRKHLIALVCVAVVVIAGAIAVIWYQRANRWGRGAVNAYYFDAANGQMFVAPRQRPPIVGPSGARASDNAGTGVLACMFSCTSCDNESDRFLGYLQTTSPGSSSKNLNTRSPVARPMGGGAVLVASPDARDTWVDALSAQGRQIVDAAAARCGAGKPSRQCWPPEHQPQ